MGILREWTTAWNVATMRTRVVACLLLFGSNQIGFAIMFLDFGEWTESRLRGASVMGSIGLLSTLLAVFLAASKLVRTSEDVDERNRKVKMLVKTVSWFALIGPLDIVLHRVSDLPVIQYGLLVAAAVGLLHLTARISLLLENRDPASQK